MSATGPLVAVTGATGYVGGRLVPRLLEAGYRVRCIVREPRKLAERPWRSHAGVSVEQGDLGDVAALTRAVLPLHNVVFGGMLRGIKRAAERAHRA